MPIRQFHGQDGATATEYLFVLVFVALVIAGGARLFGTALDARFSAGGSSVGAAID